MSAVAPRQTNEATPAPETLALLRKERDLSQKELAWLATNYARQHGLEVRRISPSTIAMVEVGERTLSAAAADAIAGALSERPLSSVRRLHKVEPAAFARFPVDDEPAVA